MDSFKKFRDWLSKSGNYQALKIIGWILGIIGGFIVAIVVAIWAIFAHFYPKAPAATPVIIAHGDSAYIEYKSNPVGYGSATVTNIEAVSLPNIPPTVQTALISIENNGIRFRLDVTNPTVTEGHLLHVGDTLTIKTRKGIDKFKAIAVDGPAVIRVTYFE